MTILDTIADYSRLRVENDKKAHPLGELRERCASVPKKGELPFENALRKEGISFICEVKKASPSKGVISETFPYLQIAEEYERAGADCISCLTEPKWFLGSDEIFRGIRAKISLPMLRKDFTVDKYQLYQAKLLGADAALLICSLLGEEKLAEFLEICEELELSALVEAHDEGEIKTAVKLGAKIIGVNNRNLKDFSVDIANSSRLRSLVPDEVLFVAESGIKNHGDIISLEKEKVDAVLIGEALMRSADKHKMLNLLKYGEKN